MDDSEIRLKSLVSRGSGKRRGMHAQGVNATPACWEK